MLDIDKACTIQTTRADLPAQPMALLLFFFRQALLKPALYSADLYPDATCNLGSPHQCVLLEPLSPPYPEWDSSSFVTFLH
jgi:hypothetical protein